MIKDFENLREDEIEVLMNAPVYVAILIAGADGNIDNSERKQAIETLRLKESKAREQLVEYYHVVGKGFEEKFDSMIKALPEKVEERNNAITAELRKLNFIFKKVNKPFCIALYASLKEFAKKIAEASGGVLGYLSISFEESQLVELKMIKDPQK